ncbi:MAG: hypothetical protein HWN68_06030 [Desulfobacterales bacterium]|nr:hypothetical protein [Desulfobacterales bacterium]
MEKDAEQNNLLPDEVRKQFDATLAQNIKRLVGASKGIGDLPLNLATISSLVLLAECESEIEGSPSNPPERYTHETFLNNLAAFGLEPRKDEELALQDMIQKGYIDIGPDGRFLATKPAMSMAQLLDHAFPGIPGMNLVAYLVQTMEEVLTGRKRLEPAIDQFDQTLQMHGVVLSRETPEHTAGRREAGQQPTPTNRQALSEVLRRLQAQEMVQRSPESAGEPRVLSATGSVEQFEIKEFPMEFEPADTAEFSTEGSPLETTLAEEEATCDDSETLEEMPDADTEQELASEQEVPLSVTQYAQEEEGLETEARPEEADIEAPPPAEAHDKEEVASKEQEAVTGEESIEERIAAFEEALAMKCPVCGTGRVRKEETAKGKHFYVCPTKGCIFISWGKPYHITCPQCKNPFLIESTDRAGNTIFRCPRATCHHRQKPPWETSEEVSAGQVSVDLPESSVVSSLQAPKRKRLVVRRPRSKAVKRRLVRRKR